MSATLSLLLIFIGAVVVTISYMVHANHKQNKEEYPEPLVRTKDGLSVVDHKQKSFEAIMLNLVKCQSKDQLLSAYNMIITFKTRYGRCEKFDVLYAEYVGILYSFNQKAS